MAHDFEVDKKPRSGCPHTGLLEEGVDSPRLECQACGSTDELRICLTCGYVGCCESQEGHDREHYETTGHPFVRPHRSECDFLWCYECDSYLS